MDGKKVNIPSFQVSTGAVIEINPNKRTSKYVEKLQSLLKEHKTQEWLELDAKNLKGRVLSKPTPTLIGSTIQMDLIVEHYNR